jgi:uncharacterized protein involved in exopolysaccharide biosynthesis/protein involved in polysaccharide export with SLBB domain/Mrp family chromosome partitioning ATPase
MSNSLSFTPQPSKLEPLQPGYTSAEPEQEFHLMDLWKVILRRRRLLIVPVIATVVLALLYCLVTPPLYRAEGKMQVLKQNTAAFLGDSAQASNTAAADALDFNLAAQTQVDVLKSRNIALAVIQKLQLDREPDYQLKGNKAENAKPLEQSPKHLDYVLTLFDKRLQAATIPGTRLLSVSFLDRDPRQAANVVNTVIDTFMNYNSQVEFNASAESTKLLRADLEKMKQNVEKSQAEVVRLQQQSGIYGVDENNNATNAKLEQLNAQLTAAQANLTLKQSIYNLAQTRSPEVLSGLIGATGTGADTRNAPLQMLQQQKAEASAAYAELLQRYGANYPKVLQAKERVDSLDASIKTEINRLVGEAAAEYRVAADTENGAARALSEQEALAAEMNHNAILYTSAKHDADASRALFDELQKRLQEAEVVAGLHTTNLNVLDPAIIPAKLAQPRWLVALLAALAAGLFTGIVLVFLVDAVDGSVHDPRKLESSTGLAVLALIPPADRNLIRSLERAGTGHESPYKISARAPRSLVAESFRNLRAAVVARIPSGPSSVIAITSTSESEGKSFTALNLATTFAQSGRSVLVIDADLLSRETPNLSLLPAGDPSHVPADVIAGPQMGRLLRQLRAGFDIIILDTPSVLEVADTLSFAGLVDGLIVIARSGSTEQHALQQTLNSLRRANGNVLGLVLNGIDFNSPDYRFYFGRRGNGYTDVALKTLEPVTPIKPSRTIVAGILFFLMFGHWHGFAQGVPQAEPVPGFTGPAATQPTPQPLQTAVNATTTVTTSVAPAGVVIGPGDLINVQVFDAPELSQDLRVDQAGNVHMLLLGDVKAATLSPGQLAASIASLLKQKDLIRQPNVNVTIKEFTTQGVTIEGEVKKPGIYPVFSDRSLLDLIALADGTTATADNRITIRRKATGKIEHVTLSQDNGTIALDGDVRVYPGDTIVVPRAGFAYVLGNVQHPGGYIMHDNGEMTVLEAISEAQGTGHTAKLKEVLLLRKTDGEVEKIPVPLEAIQHGKRPDMPLQAGDVVFVPTSGIKSFGANTEAIFASVSGAALYTLH